MRLRVLAASVLVGAIILAGAWVSAMPAVAPTWTPFPTDTPVAVYGTATHLVAGATDTAQANPTANSLMSLTPQTNLDPILVTATAIVVGATQTQAYYMTTTATPNPIDPIYVTATYIVGRATQTEAAYMTAIAGGPLPTAFVTSAPTLSPQDEEDLIAGWIAELETASGFSHPIFGVIAYDLLKGFRFNIEHIDQFPGLDTNISVMPVVTRVEYNGYEYVALITREPIISEATLWVFRLTDGEPILMSGDLPFSLGAVYGDLDPSQYAFNDFNKNGLPDVMVDFYSGGSCPSTWLGLFEIQPDGNVINVAKMIPENGPGSVEIDTNLYDSIIRFESIDVNDDGIPEIEMVGKYFDFPEHVNAGCSFLPVTRYYAWDGNGYQDITATLDESYYPSIDTYFKSAQESGCSLPGSQVIVDYFVLGRLKEGWARIASQMHLEMCPAETLVGRGEEIGKFLAWVGMLLELEQQDQSKVPS